MIDYQALGKDFLAQLARFGYTQINGAEVRISVTGDSVTFNAHFVDDFQKDARWDETVQHGFYSLSFEEGVFRLPFDFKTREQRELHFMAKRYGNSKELAAQMISAAGRAFAEKMEAELLILRTMIAGPTIEEDF